MNYELGKKIRLLRLSRNMTQEQLADKLGITAQSVSKWENGITAPDIQLLPEISVLLGVTIDELFSITDEAKLQRIENLLEAMGESVLLAERDFGSYIDFLTEKKENPKLRGRVLTALANLYNQQANGYFGMAAEYAMEAVEQEPEEKGNHSALCEAWKGAKRDWYAGNHHRLISYYMSFVERYPDNIYANQLLLDNLLADNRMDEAQAYLAKCKVLRESCRFAWYDAQILYGRGEYEKAGICINQMKEQFAHDWLASAYCGDFYARSGSYEEAIKCYENALTLQPAPRYIDSLLCMAEIRVIQKRFAEAAGYYRRTVELLKSEWNITDGDMVEKMKALAAQYEGVNSSGNIKK